MHSVGTSLGKELICFSLVKSYQELKYSDIKTVKLLLGLSIYSTCKYNNTINRSTLEVVLADTYRICHSVITSSLGMKKLDTRVFQNDVTYL